MSAKGVLLKTPQFDLNHLLVFGKIAETGSLTKAAQSLNLPKSRVSRILSSLERDLGVQLIHRTTRHLQLTDLGRRFYNHSQGPLTGLIEAARDLSECNDEIMGLIRMTAAEDFGMALLPGLVDEFTRLYPKVSFEILLAQESLNLVQESIDVAIRIGALKDSRMKAQKIADINLILAASPAFIESRPPMNHLSDLLNVPCIGFSTLQNRGWTFTNGREKKTVKVEPTITSNNPSFALRLALRGRGVALLPDYLCHEPLKGGQLAHLFRSWRSEQVPVSLVFPYQKQLPPHVRRFADFLIGKLRAAIGKGD